MTDLLHSEYLRAMGIEQWLARDRIPEYAATPAPDISARESVADLDWPTLETRVASCTACTLHAARTRTVFGTGNRQADWLIVGEAPGADEDRQGEPFVGPAGKLLTAMLQAVGFQRADVYITNILKCRPPGNRDPLPEEVNCCHAYLQRQVDLIRPSLILAVGRIAAHHLLHTEQAVGKLRGQVHSYGAEGIPLVVTYHPAYLLRKPLEKRKAWDDLQLAQRIYRERVTG